MNFFISAPPLITSPTTLPAPARPSFSSSPSLEQLKGIHLPDPISFWPPATGWWFLGAFLLISLCTISVWQLTQWRKRAYQREALQTLAHLETQYLLTADQKQLLNDVSTLMRRICLTQYPRNQVASLTGKRWLTFLDTKGNTKQFTEGSGAALVEQKFNPYPHYEVNELINICRLWIKQQQ